MTKKKTEIMMKKNSILLAIAASIGILLMATSCKTPRVKNLEAENAKLQNDIVKSDSVQIQFMNAYAEIEANLNEIKLREKMINENSLGAESNPDMQQRIISDIVEIGKLMENNRQKLQNMESLRRQLISARSANKKLTEENRALKQGIPAPAPVQVTSNPEDQQKIAELTQENARLAELNKTLEETITRLKNQLTESEARIESLQEELSLLKEAYAALEAINDSLQASNQTYLAQLEEKDNQINTLNSQLSSSNRVYYIVANSKNLKAKKIMDKKNVNPNVNLNNFTSVENYNDLRIIETKSSKATVLSQHPSRSYTINTRDKKNVKIEIKNPESFWSTSKVCVIEIK